MNMNKKASPGLGRGLGALISGAADYNPVFQAKPADPASETDMTGIRNVPIDRIDTNPFQPRQNFDDEALAELSESIRTLGLIQPITVRESGGRYQIISGERRFRACRMAGLDSIPAYIRKADDRGMLEMAIVENIQRENLDAIEVAMSFQRLIEECNLTQEQMAERVGKKRATVTNYLRLLRLPAEIQLSIRAGKLSMGHAKALLSVENQRQQLRLCNSVIEKDLSVRQLENKIQNSMKHRIKEEERDSRSVAEDLPDCYYRLLEVFGKYFEKGAVLKRNGKKGGSVTVSFSDDAEIEVFVKKLEDLQL